MGKFPDRVQAILAALCVCTAQKGRCSGIGGRSEWADDQTSATTVLRPDIEIDVSLLDVSGKITFLFLKRT